ncbi:MAG: hypothetical protein FWE71_17405 [Nocardioidaceae bacterium]|nr:hypothetical protein [Nocardioidaceae bacterium]MCL2611972.1 hypothetical protein [Nocardioidaceae bacterium]
MTGPDMDTAQALTHVSAMELASNTTSLEDAAIVGALYRALLDTDRPDEAHVDLAWLADVIDDLGYTPGYRRPTLVETVYRLADEHLADYPDDEAAAKAADREDDARLDGGR